MKREPSGHPRLWLQTLLTYLCTYNHIYIYIYIYIYIHISSSCSDSTEFLKSLLPSIRIIHQSWQVFQAALCVCIESLLFSQHWQESIRQHCLWVRPCFSSSALHVLLFLLGLFLRWEAGSYTSAILWGIASRICSKQHATVLCSSYQAFSQCVLLAFMWCIHILVLTQLQLRRNPILFYWIDQISIWSVTSQQHSMPSPNVC